MGSDDGDARAGRVERVLAVIDGRRVNILKERLDTMEREVELERNWRMVREASDPRQQTRQQNTKAPPAGTDGAS